MLLALTEVVVPEKRMRGLGDVGSLAASMRDIGLLNPITLTMDNRLVSGLHRLEAAKRLGWAKIECRCIDVSDLQAKLAEIDENLIRNELTVLERCEHLAERKNVYEALHPETKAGVAGGTTGGRGREKVASEKISFATDTAAKTNVTRRTVEQEVHVVKNVPSAVRSQVRGTPVADRKSDLMKLARMDAAEQKQVADKIEAGAKSVKEAKKQLHREAKTPTTAAVKKSATTWKLIHASCKDLDLAKDSVDCIITDPPYPKEFLPCYSDLGEMAARVLKPSGSCIVMCGQSYLPSIIEQLGDHLAYHWMVAYLTPGGQAVQLWDRKVNTFWKPLLWFIKPPFKSSEWQGDVLGSKTNDNDKRFHDWGQSESGMASIVDRFTFPGQVILDPFVGGGTTGIVAVKLGRQFIGSDSDAAQIEIARARLES